MKNTFRKLMIILLLVCSSACFLLGACNCNGNGEELYERDKAFKLNYTKYTLSLFESFDLVVDGYSNVVFTSSDENVISVSETGRVYAKNYGTAKITASSTKKSAECIVIVENQGDVPYLIFNLLDKNLYLLKDQTFALETTVNFNNNLYDDASFSYLSSEPTVASVDENGVVTAFKKGSCFITVQASWRGYDVKYLTENIEITVSSNVSMQVSVSKDTVYTVANAIDGKTYENTFEISCSATVDGLAVESSKISYNFDSERLELNGNVFTALSKGQTQVYAVVNNGNEIYTSLPISINVLAPEIKMNKAYSAKVGGSEYPLTVDGLLGEGCAVRNGDSNYTDYSVFEDGKVSINTANIIKPRGKTEIRIETDLYTYLVDVYFGTHILETKEDFIEFSNSYGKGKNVDTNHWYVVLANDIDLKGATVYKTWEDSFHGIFDGAGYEISNVKTKDYGIFGLVSREIKNVSIYNVVADNGYLLSGYVSGKISNVYLKGSYLSSNASGVLNFSNIALIENSVFDVTHVGSEGFVLRREALGTGYVKNVIALGNSKSFSNDPADLETIFDTAEDFIVSGIDKISVDNGFNFLWDTDEYGAYFNGKAYITKQPEETLEVIYKGVDFDLDVYDIANGKPDKIYINGKLTEVPADGQDLTIVADEYVAGNNEIIIFCNGEVIRQPFVKASHQISTAEQFVNFLASYNGNVDEDTNDSENYYAILTCDIDLSAVNKKLITKSSADRFAGTFNGLGHSLKNASVGYWNSSTDSKQGGIFGNVLGTVENLAIINIRCSVGWPFAWGIQGTVRNVYIQGDLTDTIETNGALSVNSGQVQNCVVNVTRNGENSVAYGYLSNSGVIENCYAIGNVENFSNRMDESRPVYVTAESFYTAEKENFTVDNGFSKYWVENNFGFFFGENSIVEFEPETVKDTEYYALAGIGQTATSKVVEVNLKEMLGGKNPERVVVNGAVVKADDTILLNSTDYVLGEENTIVFGDQENTVKLPFVFVTYTISNKTEFTNFIASYNNNVSSDGWYVILNQDINMDYSEVGKTAGHYFKGVFDGLGHKIDKFRFNGDAHNYGLFGYVSGTIKNVAFTNGQLTWNSYGLTTYLSGTIENVYVQASLAQSNFTNFLINLGWGKVHGKDGYGYVRNCVFNVDFDYNISSAKLIMLDNPDPKYKANVVNTFAIASGYTYKLTASNEDTRTPFVSASALLSAHGSEFTASNGFSKYWLVDGTKLSFAQIEIN